MAIVPTLLTSSYDNVDRTSYTTTDPLLDDNDGQLILACILNGKATVADTPTLTGGGGTWVQVATVGFTSDLRRLTIFRACSASFTDGALTVDFAGATQVGCGWAVIGWTGTAATTGANGSDGITESLTNSGTALTGTVTLADITAGNASFGFFGHSANEATTFGSGYTELSDNNGSAPNVGFQTEWKSTGSVTIDASWATSVGWGGIGLEITASGGAPAGASPDPFGMMGFFGS